MVEDKFNFLMIVNGFFALAIWLATKHNAFSVFSFIDVVALRNFFCSSCSRFFSKYSKGLSFNPGCLLSKWQNNFEGFITS